MNYELKPITTADVKLLQTLSRETFTDTFGADNTEENLTQYLNEAYDLNKLTSELEDPESNFHFLFFDGQLAGYLKLNVGNAQSEPEGDDALEIERIYIRNGFKRHGLGTSLIKYATEQAKTLDKKFIWLGCWEHNDMAIKFYHKMGFEEFSEHVFQMGDDPQRDILMKKEL